MMKKYQIWAEGFRITGGAGEARLVATVTAASFKAACDKFFHQDRLYDSENMTHWGCKLFDNEEEARKSFG